MQKYFFIKTNGKYLKIYFDEIAFVEGCRNYIKIETENKSYLVLITMKRMEQLLSVAMFRRIHKSFIVSLDKIIQFDSERVYLKDKELPIGQLYKGELEKSLMIVDDTSEVPGETNLLYKMPLLIKANQRNRLSEAG